MFCDRLIAGLADVRLAGGRATRGFAVFTVANRQFVPPTSYALAGGLDLQCSGCNIADRFIASRKPSRSPDMDTINETISTDTTTANLPAKSPMPLEKELSVYDANLIDLVLANEGKYVVIFGSEIGGVFESYEEALKAGYDKYELEPFLVKQINRNEPIYYFSRDLSPCNP